MRIKALVAAVMIFFLVPQAGLAVYQMDKEQIGEAQEYGTKSVLKSADEFLSDWRSFEEQAEVLDESISEYAYFYTPFLLVANDARAKSIEEKKVEIASGENIVADYKGYFTFRTVLIGDKPDFTEKIKAVLRQDKFSADGQAVGTVVRKLDGGKKNLYLATVDFHFKNQRFSLVKPVFLRVTLKNKQERRFYFDLANLR